MSSSSVTTQWDRLRLHNGCWHGSFARLDAVGQQIAETPSIVTLRDEEQDAANSHSTPPPIHQTVAFGDGAGNWQPPSHFTYRSLSRGILFFDTGAYSQGSLQASPIATFGAEFGFVMGDRRFRAVVQYTPSSSQNLLTQLTLIREHRDIPAPDARSPLHVEQLVGTWQGQSTSIDPDWYESIAAETELVIQQTGDRLHQTLSFPGFKRQSTAVIENHRLLFSDAAKPEQPSIQVLLLPDGASITAPLSLPKGQAFFLEIGWLVAPTKRYRLIRHYDAQGAWSHLTLVEEKKVTPSDNTET
ncbi:MAG: DUF3598 family protein [Cyanobacteria bacterium J06638_22]